MDNVWDAWKIANYVQKGLQNIFNKLIAISFKSKKTQSTQVVVINPSHQWMVRKILSINFLLLTVNNLISANVKGFLHGILAVVFKTIKTIVDPLQRNITILKIFSRKIF